MTGTLPRPGTCSTLPEYSSCNKPPSTTMAPSSTSTLDSMERLLVVGPLVAARVAASMLDTSWNSVSRMVPFSLICGLTRSVSPTSLRSMVWKGLTVPPLPEPVLVNWPVTNGTFWPMTILASSLSSVSKLGVDSTLPLPFSSKKRAKKPSTYTPPCSCANPRFTPRAGATVPLAAPVARFRMLRPAVPKLLPSKPITLSPLLPTAPCH